MRDNEDDNPITELNANLLNIQVNNNQNGNPVTVRNTNFRKNKVFKKIIKYIFILAQVITAIVSVFVICKTNTLTNTANLLQLNNAIQDKTEAFDSVELKKNGIELSNGDTDNNVQTLLIYKESKNALTALLNIYEFACQQYISKKIDRKAFKSLYDVMIKHIMEKYIMPKYKNYKELYPAIYQVYAEWYGK